MTGPDVELATSGADLDALQETLGYHFSDRALLERALCHASFAHEQQSTESNERLEFLGDAVLGLFVAHRLFEMHPDWREGDLTRAMHALVERTSLAKLGRRLDIGAYLQLGRTERRSAGEAKESILADSVEAILGAMYMDGGMAPIEALLGRSFEKELAADAPRVQRDPKTLLQERVMAQLGEFPVYRLVEDSSVEGDLERFSVEVLVQGEAWGAGTGRSKRSAERAAAEEALPRLTGLDHG